MALFIIIIIIIIIIMLPRTNENHEATLCVIFSILLFLPLFWL